MTAATTSDERWRLGYRPGLDGVRGIAILCVLALHSGLAGERFAFAGAVGVTIFFVLSGFLITRLLLQEREQSGRVNLAAFYMRRARRLLPALVVMLAVLTVLAPWAFDDVLWALSYMSNWVLALGHELPTTGHTWSLAIEEQFYLLWPLAFIALRRHPVAATIAAIAVCWIGRATLPWDMGWEFFAFATPMQAPSLLVGVLLAYAHWPRVRWPVLLLAGGGVGLVIAAALPLTEWGHRLRDPLAALSAVPLIMAGHDGALSWRPLAALGRISYGVYLWHGPALVLTGTNYGERGLLPAFVVIGVSIAIAAASYIWIERPILSLRWSQRPSLRPRSVDRASPRG